jgi:hypothetical protein
MGAYKQCLCTIYAYPLMRTHNTNSLMPTHLCLSTYAYPQYLPTYAYPQYLPTYAYQQYLPTYAYPCLCLPRAVGAACRRHGKTLSL